MFLGNFLLKFQHVQLFSRGSRKLPSTTNFWNPYWETYALSWKYIWNIFAKYSSFQISTDQNSLSESDSPTRWQKGGPNPNQIREVKGKTNRTCCHYHFETLWFYDIFFQWYVSILDLHIVWDVPLQGLPLVMSPS